MGNPLTFLAFDHWVKHVFDHEVRKPEWYWDKDALYWDAPSELTVEYLTQLFGRPLPTLANYSDEQLNQGFWYLLSPGCSNHMFAVTDEAVPLELRIKCVKSIQRIFEQMFSGLCSEHLSHIDEKGAAPLNSICYMWWDLVPLQWEPGEPSKESISKAALEVMEETLTFDSIACQESALHGLGHWELFYPTEVAEIVDRYLEDNPNLRSELKDYAVKAREGHVL
jgi:hypothetical protein